MSETTLKTTFQLRRGTAAEWISANPTLAKGEPGFETDTYKLKIGDGTTKWSNLNYFGGTFTVSADGKSINLEDSIFSIYGFNNATTGQVPTKGADGKIQWVAQSGGNYTAGENIQISAQNVISATDTIYDDTDIKADITSLQNNKLNVLPKVDDPTDPGFGWEYHIPYNFEATPDAEKINITLKTLTLDNKVTKMNFDKTLPAATTTTAGLMTAADKVALNGKQDKLTAGSNITIDANNVISATGGGSAVLTQELTAGYTIGGIEEGKVYAVGTSIEQILRDLFIKVTPAQNHLYYGVGKTIPTSVSGLTSVATTKETLLEDGYVWRNITLDEEYAFLAIDKSLGVSCYEIKQNGFSLGYETVDLGDQILYYPSDPATDTEIRLEYAFE